MRLHWCLGRWAALSHAPRTAADSEDVMVNTTTPLPAQKPCVDANRNRDQERVREHAHDRRGSDKASGGAADDVTSYTIKKGDTLASIARAHGCTVQELRELNPDIKGDKIITGQQLEVLKVQRVERRSVDENTQRGARERATSSEENTRARIGVPEGGRYSVPAPSFAEVKAGGESIRRNMGGDHVKELQRLLNRQGANLDVDGKFGPKTQAAVREFQERSRMPQSGVVDKRTLESLERARPRPAPERSDRSDRSNRPGDSRIEGFDPRLGPTRSATAYTNGQPRTIQIVTVQGKNLEVNQARRFLEMQEAARRDGVDLQLISGFRTMAEQRRLYDGWVNRRPGFNLAARPGYSEHQNGTALDLNTTGSSDSRGTGKVYNWLVKNAGKFGFERIPAEHWHWEFKGAR